MRVLGRQASYHIGELSEIAAARRAGAELAEAAGFDELRAGELALLITEAATNIAKHANEGHILLRPIADSAAEDAQRGVEILALDQGPGIANLPMQMIDGNSTAGTYGGGFGAMQRLAHELDIHTEPDKGTVVYLTLWQKRPDSQKEDIWQIGAVCLPLPGESGNGDAWSAQPHAAGLTLMVVDGIGHGENAESAAQLAVDTFAAHADALPAQLLHFCHGAMMGSRGGAVAIAAINVEGELRFAGIGNVAATIFERHAYDIPERRHLISHNGIVGNNMRKTQEFIHPWQASSMLIMHTDGVNTRWDLTQYTGLIARHPAVIAALLYRDHSRGRDDATVVVLREANA